MRGSTGTRWVLPAAVAAVALVALTGCAERSLNVQPAGGSGSAASPSATVSAAVPSAGVTTDPSGLVITRNGSTVCVKSRNGGQACSSGTGTIVVDGITVSNGVVVGGSANPTPVPTKGTVKLSGALTFDGAVTGTCDGKGTQARTVKVDLPGKGPMVVTAVGGGVLKISLETGGDTYSLEFVGQSKSPVTLSAGRTVLKAAQLGQGVHAVMVDADFDC